MRISFDLDDTLICHGLDIPREPNRVPPWLRWWLREPLRLGAVELLSRLQNRHEIWIYTTSFRSPRYVRWLFYFYGIRIRQTVNQRLHNYASLRGPLPSKAPHVFGIDLHVDDSEGVRRESLQSGFRMVRVELSDSQWALKVQNAVATLETELASQHAT